jgi:hypothetical protein
MKKLIIAVLAILLAVFSATAGEGGTASSEFSLAPQLFIPGSSRYELYDIGYGVETQYRYWFFEPFGVAFSLGLANFEIDSGSDDFAPIAVDGGSMFLVPIGPSALFRIVDLDVWTLTFEAGIRYVLVNSDLDLASGGSVSVDDGVISVLALKAEWYLSDTLSFFTGIGHDDDIVKGEVDEGRMRSNELQSFVFDLGLRLFF